MRGLFLTFEGIEGSGKTTQAALLEQALAGAGKQVLRTREPGGTDLAEQIRKLILDVRQEPVHRETELLLFLAARAQHVRERIRPALDAGQVDAAWVVEPSLAAVKAKGGRIIASNYVDVAPNLTVALFPAQITSGYAGRKLVSGAGGLPFWALFVLSIAGGAADTVARAL